MVNNVALYLGTVATFIRTVCLFGCLLMCRCSFESITPLPDVTAVRKTDRKACRQSSIQHTAGVFSGESRSVEMGWPETCSASV